jgi:hypothetical protein
MYSTQIVTSTNKECGLSALSIVMDDQATPQSEQEIVKRQATPAGSHATWACQQARS